MASGEVESGPPVGRRIVLGMLGLGALGVVAGAGAARGVSAVTAGAPALASLLPGAGGFRFYSVTAEQPDVSREAWRMPVTGLVERPRTFAWSDLSALPQTALTRDFQCVTGWRVDDVPWGGVLLRDVLAAVGVRSPGTALHITSLDGEYTESLTLEQARRDDVLVATSMYGAPVTREHGGPVRLLVAPMYGYKSLKWLGGIEVVATRDGGYWEERGYDVDAWVGASNGRDDEPVT